jgi:Carboxypeptidase regulatory-like domain
MSYKIATLCILVLATAASCQRVEIGPPDSHYCDRIKVAPNLIVKRDAEISGRLIDASGEPFRHSPVELRIFISATKQLGFKTVKTDDDGHFQIDSVKAGKYRLIASPTRAFQQPAQLQCDDERCEFAITLTVNPTDMPDSQCPVR